MTLAAMMNWKCLRLEALTGNAQVNLTRLSCLLRPVKVLLFNKK